MRNVAHAAKGLFRSPRGSVAIQLALSMTAILGMVGLGGEISFLLFKHRQMQSAADTAALGGAIAKAKGFPSDYALEARAIAASAGFVNGVGNVSVTINNPPHTGNYTANSSAVEVVISQQQTLSLVSLFQSGLFTVGTKAVAVPGGTGTVCVLQLLPNSSPGASLSNGATVSLVNCGINANSTSSSSLSVTGAAVLNTQFVSVSGMTTVSNGGVINATNGTKIKQAAVADPYAAVAKPSYSGCNYTNSSYGHSNSGRQFISPGVYCNGLAFKNDAIVTMNPGVYIIDRGTFDVGGAVQLTGTGVTIILTSSTGSNYANVNIGNGANAVLTAPTSGPLAGLAFFGDRAAPSSNSNIFGGGATFSITGAIYMPSQLVKFSNGVSNPSGCTQLIAGTIQFTGAAQFKSNCGGTGVTTVGGAITALVE